MKVSAFLAYKDLIRDKKIAVLVIFLLAFSYMNLTFFPAFLNGLSDTFQNEAVDTGTSHIIIQPRIESKQAYLSFESGIRKKIDLVPGVVGSSSHISLSSTIFFEGKQIGAQMTALKPSEEKEVTTIHTKLLKGEFLSDEDTDEIVMGEVIAGQKIEDLIGNRNAFGTAIQGLGGVDIGERIRVVFSNGAEKEYKVKGIVGSEGFSFVSQTVYISKKEAESILGIKDKASSILVRLNSKENADQYKKIILDLGLVNANIQTWEEASTFAEGINQTFGVVILVTTFVAVIIVISTVGIVVFINITRKKRIIGVLKSIGMRKNQIMAIFLLESLIFGIVGTFFGVVIFYSSIFYLQANPIDLPIGELRPFLPQENAINAIIILLISSIIAGYIPARTASRQKILETIKVVE